jgi:hypothetical protein
MEIAFGPDSLITPIAPTPGGVDKATIVSSVKMFFIITEVKVGK